VKVKPRNQKRTTRVSLEEIFWIFIFFRLLRVELNLDVIQGTMSLPPLFAPPWNASIRDKKQGYSGQDRVGPKEDPKGTSARSGPWGVIYGVEYYSSMYRCTQVYVVRICYSDAYDSICRNFNSNPVAH
jgi:hypothetical protein